jgi:aryl-alcohol dehydrogenase-like predicted oxidoreductase
MGTADAADTLMIHGMHLVQVGRYGPEEFDFSRERVTASVSESLQRLQVCSSELVVCFTAQGPSCSRVPTLLYSRWTP